MIHTYFILQNKYLYIFKDSFVTKILRDDCILGSFCTFVLLYFSELQFQKALQIEKINMHYAVTNDCYQWKEQTNKKNKSHPNILLPRYFVLFVLWYFSTTTPQMLGFFSTQQDIAF